MAGAQGERTDQRRGRDILGRGLVLASALAGASGPAFAGNGLGSQTAVRPVGTGLGGSRSFMDLPGPSSGVESLSDGKATHATYDLRYRTLGRLTRPQLVFVNQYFSNFRETKGPNPIAVSATIETRGGRSFPVTSAGR